MRAYVFDVSVSPRLFAKTNKISQWNMNMYGCVCTVCTTHSMCISLNVFKWIWNSFAISLVQLAQLHWHSSYVMNLRYWKHFFSFFLGRCNLKNDTWKWVIIHLCSAFFAIDSFKAMICLFECSLDLNLNPKKIWSYKMQELIRCDSSVGYVPIRLLRRKYVKSVLWCFGMYSMYLWAWICVCMVEWFDVLPSQAHITNDENKPWIRSNMLFFQFVWLYAYDCTLTLTTLFHRSIQYGDHLNNLYAANDSL